MQCARYVRIVKYWLKIMKCNNTRFTKIVYNVLLCDAQIGKSNWVSRPKNLLETLGFGHVWLYQSVENDELFSEILISVFEIIMVKDCILSCRICQGENILYHKHFFASKYLDL